MYEATVTPEQAAQLAADGFDIVDQRSAPKGMVKITLVLTRSAASELRKSGIQLTVYRNEDGLTATQLAAKQEAGGYKVWRSWDEPGGIEDEIRRVAARNPNIVKLVDLGDTYQGRDILALKVTKNAEHHPRWDTAGGALLLGAARA